jgi:hypothetical protein
MRRPILEREAVARKIVGNEHQSFFAQPMVLPAIFVAVIASEQVKGLKSGLTPSF